VSTKLVEVALPLEAISKACKADKDRKVGTIKNVHKWFAPMPTPAWRALLFATLIDDPGDEEARAQLLKLITRLVPEHGGAPDMTTLEEARKLIQVGTADNPPTVFDPFCGGGSTLVEAQRLGLPAIGSDLNPVAVLITRTISELIPQVSGRPPLVVTDTGQLALIGGPLDGFLADCAHYARRVRDQVWEKVGHLYPTAPGGETVVAWLWARTVRCPNPACRATAPLISSYWLSKREGAETWLKPIDCRPGSAVRFEIGVGPEGPPTPPKQGRGGTFRCIVCGEPTGELYLKGEGLSGRLGLAWIAAAVDGPKGRTYTVDPSMEPPQAVRPTEIADVELPDDSRNFWCKLYGVSTFTDLFTDRQLTAMCAFADSVSELHGWVLADGGDPTYAAAVASVLGLCLGKLSSACSTQVRWFSRKGPSKAVQAFSRHALPMVWDFAETNPFGASVGDWLLQLDSVSGGLRSLPTRTNPARVFQGDARLGGTRVNNSLVATDPPYFAQIAYADLSDYFYIWMRRSLKAVHPDLFATLATPKADELIAAPYRHGGSMQAATDYFVSGFTETFTGLGGAELPEYPMLVVYAHRQEESQGGALSSTAWDAMLTAILSAGQRIVGTWPIRATHTSRQIGLGTNALASYVVIICRPRVPGAKIVDRQRLLATLRAELPKAIRKLQEAAVSSIDLGQATIGPGMAIFSQFSRVIGPDGQAMPVRAALELIGQVQGEVLDEFVGDLDPETRWAMVWHRDHGFDDGSSDDAEKLFRTTNTSLERLRALGIVDARAGKVRLRSRDELPPDWSPREDHPPIVWQVAQHLTKRVASGGEDSAVSLFRKARKWVDEARALAYWLSGNAATRGRAKDALDYDALITSWPILLQKASGDEQTAILGEST
jgi:putative DNA methylase